MFNFNLFKENERDSYSFKLGFTIFICVFLANVNASSEDSSNQVYQINGIELDEETSEIIKHWQVVTETMLEEISKRNKNANAFEFEQRQKEILRLGIVFSNQATRKTGVEIVAVTPGGLMQKLGVKTGDIIYKVNHILLNKKSSMKNKMSPSDALSSELQGLIDGEPIEISLKRDNKDLQLTGIVETVKVPGFTFKIEPKKAFLDDAKCSEIRSIKFGNLHRVEFLEVNGVRLNSKYKLKLPKGLHVLKVKEHISANFLNDKDFQNRTRKVTVKVECGKKYNMLANYNEKKKRNGEEYWDVMLFDLHKNPVQFYHLNRSFGPPMRESTKNRTRN